MANTTLHWKFREVMAEFRDEGRLAVYLCYLLHANHRSRAWPSVETICSETGWSTASVVEAKKWLVERGALKPVPYTKRVDDETQLHQRVDIMEVTGVFEYKGETVPILYANQYVNISVSKIMPAENEVTTTTGGALDAPADDAKPKPIVRVWEEETKQIVTLSVAEALHDYEDDFGYEWVVDAIKEAVATLGVGRIGHKYILGILTRWRDKGRDAPKPNDNGNEPPPQYKRILT